MKWASSRQGIQILAENDIETVFLQKLFMMLPATAEHSYEDGELNIMLPKDAGIVFGFSTEEIQKSDFVIEFNR